MVTGSNICGNEISCHHWLKMTLDLMEYLQEKEMVDDLPHHQYIKLESLSSNPSKI
jgi:hypothetical protein